MLDDGADIAKRKDWCVVQCFTDRLAAEVTDRFGKSRAAGDGR